MKSRDDPAGCLTGVLPCAVMKHARLVRTARASVTLLCGALLCASAYATENLVTGSLGDDRLIDTPGVDHFFGGDGADTFVLGRLTAKPDHIIDFDPAEGDTIELRFDEARSPLFTDRNLSINRRGVISWQTDGRRIPIIGVNESRLRIQVDKRKGRVLLRLSAPL